MSVCVTPQQHVKTYLLTIYCIGISAFTPMNLSAAELPADSAAGKSRANTATTRLTTRLSSMGMFNYGGKIVSANPSADIMYVREGRNLCIQAFKAFDLYDLHTDMNFAAAFAYRNFNIGKRLTVSPYAGVVALQLHSIADKGTDLAARLMLSYKVLPELTVEHTAILTNLVLKPGDLDWVNRLRVTYSKKSLDASVSIWHNNTAFDKTAYFTTALNLTYARVRVSDHVLLNTGITSVIMPYSNNEDQNPRKNGLIMTVAAVIQ